MIRLLFQFSVSVVVLQALHMGIQPPIAMAYEPPLEEIIARSLRDRSYFGRAIIETESAVYDPFANTQSPGNNGKVRTLGVGADEVVSELQEDKGFRQTIYWVRNRLLAVETFAMNGELLHFYLKEGLEPVSVNFSESRPFADIDLLNPYLPFIEDNREDWETGLDRWGLQPQTVSLVRASKGVVYFQLLESPGKSLWLDRIRFLPARINTLIEGDPSPLAITIEFTEFILVPGEEEQMFAFPRTINHLLDGALFKQTTVRSLLVNPSWRSFPLTRLRKKALAVSESANQFNPAASAVQPKGIQ